MLKVRRRGASGLFNLAYIKTIQWFCNNKAALDSETANT
jgi:hypothetical protein